MLGQNIETPVPFWIFVIYLCLSLGNHEGGEKFLSSFDVEVVFAVKDVRTTSKNSGIIYVMLVEKLSDPTVKIRQHLFALVKS
jgi:hypothetical protein